MSEPRSGPLCVCSAIALSVALWSPAVSAQNVKEKFTGFAINMNSGPKTAVLDFDDHPLVDRRRTGAAAGDREGEQESDRQAAAGAAEAAQGRLHPDTAVARLGSALRAPNARSTRADARSCWRPTARSTSGKRATSRARSTIRSRSSRCIWTRTTRASGKILVGTKIYIDKKTNNLVLENYAQQPVMFNEIKKVK